VLGARPKGRIWIVFAGLAGAFMALASPPANIYPTVWLGMAALAYILDEPTGRAPASGRAWFAGAGRGLAYGVVANLIACRFVPAVVTRFTPLPWAVGALGLLLLSAEQGVRWMVAAMVREQLARRGVTGWAAFAIGVYTGSFVPIVFPWTPAAALSPWPALVQLADIVGERGVSLLIALSAGLLASAVRALPERRRATSLLLAGLALPLAMLVHGTWRMGQVETVRQQAPTARIALVQPGTGARERWDEGNRDAILARLASLTRSAEGRGAALTVWPEAAYPFPVGHWTRRCPTGRSAMLPFGVRGPVLTGLIMTSSSGDLYNSAAVCSADGELSEPYDKVHLLWFGETVPIIDQIPWIRQRFSRGTGLRPGKGNVVQEISPQYEMLGEPLGSHHGPVRASVLNCFEDMLPGAGREAMDGSPNLLVNITNDAWFTGSYESEFHLRFSILRTVEERRDLVRAVNLGPTTWVDATGRVRARYDDPLPGSIVVEPALLDGPRSAFGRWGDAPTAIAIAIGLGVAGALARTKRKERRAP
jgi:apolipoprotein N-acyltransferase